MDETLSKKAMSWVRSLVARGVSVTLRGNRITIPPAAYKDMSDDERATLRHCREEIKTVVRNGISDETTNDEPEEQPITPADAPAPTAAPTVDRDAVWKREDLDAWCTMHAREPEAVEHRRQQASAEMRRSLRVFGRYYY